MFSVVCFRYEWLFCILTTNQLSKVVLFVLTNLLISNVTVTKHTFVCSY